MKVTYLLLMPQSMTKYYQPFDVNLKWYLKCFLKNKFNEWYSFQVSKQTTDRVMPESIQVKLGNR